MSASSEQDILLNTSVQYLKGVGERRARLLAKLGIHNILDLMEHFPRTYINRKINPSLAEMEIGELVSLTTEISWVDIHSTAKGKSILNVGVNDGNLGLTLVWFKFPKHYPSLFKPGRPVYVSGVLSEYNQMLQMNHPQVEFLEDEQELDFWQKRLMLPAYPLTEGITQALMRRIIYSAFASYAKDIQENLPDSIIEKHRFLPRREALQVMHFGLDEEKIKQTHLRFAYEEFFYAQLMWARHQRHHYQKDGGICFVNHKRLTTSLKNRLPFSLTSAQKRVIREIFEDMQSTRQMSRLVQGDVGSGKTIVCLFAMLLAVENGYQAALMAPTEILAEQHYQSFRRLLGELKVKTILLKGGSYKGKGADKEQIKSGEAQLIIGTHALIQKDVEFENMGLIVIDEQHRFGVQQRATLAKRTPAPDLLYLSATPIPRSLAITAYGDLELSQIDELPPNRKKVHTYIRSSQKFNVVLGDVKRELDKGRQAYFVCPLIEESDKIDLLDAQRLFEFLSTKAYPNKAVELMHGRLKSAEKDEIMQRFKTGQIDVLVSTTVIEVGLDVPNATVMVIEHAERFGLAQLHQLRGRVGRGADQSFCYLISYEPLSRIARERLRIMSISSDGFVIAEKDLELRGPGELFGLEQSGLPNFKFANLIKDQSILNLAKEDAKELILRDGDLKLKEHESLKNNYHRIYKEKEALILY